jgi:hypothetical protein
MTQFEKNKNNLKKSWDVIKTVINKRKTINKKKVKIMINGHLTDNKLLIAESFNKFFTNVGQNLDNNIPRNSINPISFIKKNFTVNIFLKPATPTEVGNIISKLKNGAPGWDEYPADLIKDNKEFMSDILTHLINLSITKGVFPSELKIGNIVPIFKAGNEEIIGNYGPVSLLSRNL